MRSRFARVVLLCGAAALTLSCATPSEPAVERAAPPPDALLWGGLDLALLRCSPLPSASSSAVVGPQGGVIEVGPHRLVIPAGALSSPVTITAEAPSSRVNQVDFGPAGLQFAVPATLTMSYANCFGAWIPLPRRIAYTTDLLSILEFLTSVDNLDSRAVSAELDHFSRYAVAW